MECTSNILGNRLLSALRVQVVASMPTSISSH